MRYMLRVTIVF